MAAPDRPVSTGGAGDEVPADEAMSAGPAMRVGFFGGTFDPPHRAHVEVARAAADTFGLERVLFAPVGRQPLKDEPALAAFADRLAMVRLACTADPRFVASSLDAPHPDGSPNFTVDALAHLSLQVPGARLFSLAGADSFATLPRWHEPQRLLRLAEWIVVSRPGTGSGAVLAVSAGLGLAPGELSRIHSLDSVHEDVSATELRRRLHERLPCAGLLPDGVARYIEQHGLYRG